jgi:hypothetical protein
LSAASFCNLAIENEQVAEQAGASSFATLRRGKVEKPAAAQSPLQAKKSNGFTKPNLKNSASGRTNL